MCRRREVISFTHLGDSHVKIRCQVKQNFNGEGFVSGGLYVVGKTGKAEFSFAETEYGRHASIDDVVKAVSTGEVRPEEK